MARGFGIIVAPETKSIRRSQEMRLDTDVDQFKYYKTIPIKRFMPSVTDVGDATSQGTITIQFPHGLLYLPAFETFLKGNRGTWGKVIRGAQAGNYTQHVEFPYFGTESVDSTNYNCTLNVWGGSTTGGIPSHEVTLRLTLFYDEAFV